MIFCPERTPSYDPVTLIHNGFCYTFEITSDQDVNNLPTTGIMGGSTALLYQKGQDTKLYKFFDKWDGPY